MKIQNATLEQIRLTGLEVLARELGPVKMIRFLQQFEVGHGDYSADRHRLLGEKKINDIVSEIQKPRKHKQNVRAAGNVA
jgi:hypothetical protein